MSNPLVNTPGIVARFKERASLTAVALRSSHEITDGLARVMITVSNPNASATEVCNAINQQLDGKAQAIPGSFRPMPGYEARGAAVGFISKNTEVRPVGADELAGYRVLAGNMFMDEKDDSLWEARESNGSRFLVRKADESLSELVALASVAGRNELVHLPECASLATAVISSGEYVAYADEETASVRFGYVLSSSDDSMEVLDSESKQTVEVNPELVVESVLMAGHDEVASVAAPSNPTKADMLEYYSKLYKHAPAFYAQLEKIINEHSVA